MSKPIFNLEELVGLGVEHVDSKQVTRNDAILTIQRVYLSKGITISRNTVQRELSRQLKASKLKRDNFARLNIMYKEQGF